MRTKVLFRTFGTIIPSMKDKIQLFEDRKVRSVWDDEAEEWFFSIVDVISVLTEQSTARGASIHIGLY